MTKLTLIKVIRVFYPDSNLRVAKYMADVVWETCGGETGEPLPSYKVGEALRDAKALCSFAFT